MSNFFEDCDKLFSDNEDGTIEVFELSHFSETGEPIFEKAGYVRMDESDPLRKQPMHDTSFSWGD